MTKNDVTLIRIVGAILVSIFFTAGLLVGFKNVVTIVMMCLVIMWLAFDTLYVEEK
ncbi:hypothetical protein ACWOAH_10315 [Vagococcus vulneris]|uniref:hypothetical protein n=1 Tax=Vagococcus vulneris TaxID=1977869 RepID=UPI00140235C9|nr:hypothetical protein [Vagococcus vulneris]